MSLKGNSQAEALQSASEIQIGESEQDAKDRVKSLMRPSWEKPYKSLKHSDIEELERLYELDQSYA